MIQCNGGLAIAGAIRGNSRKKLHQERGFESAQQRRWYKKLFSFQNNEKSFSQVPLWINTNWQDKTHDTKQYSSFNVKPDYYFKNSLFPSTISEWINLDSNIRNSESLALFKKPILAFIRPSANSTFSKYWWEYFK